MPLLPLHAIPAHTAHCTVLTNQTAIACICLHISNRHNQHIPRPLTNDDLALYLLHDESGLVGELGCLCRQHAHQVVLPLLVHDQTDVVELYQNINGRGILPQTAILVKENLQNIYDSMQSLRMQSLRMSISYKDTYFRVDIEGCHLSSVDQNH